MKFFKMALVAVAALAGSAFAGFYVDGSIGLMYSDYEVVDHDYYVSKTDANKTYSDSADGTFKVDGDRQRFSGVGPGFDLKIGYSWEYGALFSDFRLGWGFGTHDGDDYFIVKDCVNADVEKCLAHSEYELKQSSGLRFAAGAGFSISPWGGTNSLSGMGGFHFGASFGFSLIETSTEDSEYVNHRTTLSDLGLGLQVEVGKNWIVSEHWDTGISLVGSWDFPARYSDGIAPEDYYTIGVMIHVSRH